MQLNELHLTNFRNIPEMKVTFMPNINIIYGDNGQGKSNLLEAISCISLGKSMRVSSDKHLIRKNETTFYIKGIAESNTNGTILEIGYNSVVKKVKVNGVEKRKLADFIGHLKTVTFTPDDLSLVKDGSSEKRLYLDVMLSQVSNKYCNSLNKYQKVLEQRNKILKDNPQYSDAMLETFDIQLAEEASFIWDIRKKCVDKISEIAPNVFKEICSDEDALSLTFVPSLKTMPNEWNLETLKHNFITDLNNSREIEKYRGHTILGPHRDDISVLMNEYDCKTYSSQGQLRLITLALKISEMFFIEETSNESPILILDDVLSELHISKIQKLLQMLNDSKRQVFISTVVPVNLQNLNYTVYEMRQGQLIRY